MPWAKLPRLEIDKSVRALCLTPYPGHPKGCPNYNKRNDCPPKVDLVEQVLDLEKQVYVVYNRFHLAEHVQTLKRKHPKWSQRQLECCLYWQGKARKQLREQVGDLLYQLYHFSTYGPGSEPTVLYTPEACGVDVTATMASLGITLEWPPRTYTYQVALVGYEARTRRTRCPA
jgi:predicted metal-binding protein